MAKKIIFILRNVSLELFKKFAIISSISLTLMNCHFANSKYDNENITQEEKINNSEKNNVVVTQRTSTSEFAVTSLSSGIIRATAQSKLSFRISGTVTKIVPHNGSIVTAGQVLAYLDDRDQRLAVRNAQDQVTESWVQLRSLIAEFGGNEIDTNSLKPNTRSFVLTKSGYYKAQTALAQANQQLEYTILRAPYTGTIANLTAKLYSFITSYESFCTLLSKDELVVEFSVLESELGLIKIGQHVRITPVVMATQNFLGSISEINPYISTQGLVLVKAKINRSDIRLFDGMNARVVIERRFANQLVIPKSAVVERSGRKVVFTVENGLAKWHYVTVSHENELEVAISGGLKTGEQIIISGSLNLAHDAPVFVQAP